MNIVLSSKRITKFFIWITVGLVFIFVTLKVLYFAMGHDYVFGLAPLFEFRYEGIIQTWFSTLLLLFSSLLCAIIAAASKKGKKPFFLQWLLLSVIFLFLSMDEALVIHERLTMPVRELLNYEIGIFYYAWVIPYGILTLLFFLIFTKFIAHLMVKIRFLFIYGICMYIVGALVFEMIGGYYDLHYQYNDFLYVVISSAEEILEMSGIIILNYAFLTHINCEFQDLQITLIP